MGSESIALAHEVETLAEWAIDSEAIARGITIIKFSWNLTSWSKISRQNNFSQQNAIQPPLFGFQSWRLSLPVGYNK